MGPISSVTIEIYGSYSTTTTKKNSALYLIPAEFMAVALYSLKRLK
jgi:hypothetical protein